MAMMVLETLPEWYKRTEFDPQNITSPTTFSKSTAKQLNHIRFFKMNVAIILALAVVACSAKPQVSFEPYPTAYPKYDYTYEVNNPPTGDIKSAQESRDGPNTAGSYQLVEPDGTLRIVTYTVQGKEGGFVANVRRVPGYAVPDPQPNEPWRMRVVGASL